jgi:predicted phosphodiesterase
MRLAIISDIHANLEALQACIEDIRQQKVDDIICLGDIVGYGANPNECIQLVRDTCPRILLGNHDAAAIGSLSTEHFNIHAKIAIEWTAENLSAGSRDFLSSLPLKEIEGSETYVHATPYEPNMWYYITSLEEAAFNFQFFDTTFCFIGHTHIPIIIVLNSNKDVFVHQEFRINALDMPGAQLLINVGSVGQPRDRNPTSCYGILDSEQKAFEYRRIDYDIQKAQAKMRKIKMPEFLITRLNDGR